MRVKGFWVLRRRRGFALGLVFLVMIVLTILVIALLSRQKSHSLATKSSYDEMVGQSLFDSAQEWLYANFERDLSLGRNGEELLYIYPDEAEDKTVTFRFVAPSSDPDEQTVLPSGTSYNNLTNNAWETVFLEDQRRFRIPPRSALIVSNISQGNRALRQVTQLVRLESVATREDGSVVGMYLKTPATIEGDVAFINNSNSSDSLDLPVWVLAADVNSLTLSSSYPEKPRIEGKLAVNDLGTTSLSDKIDDLSKILTGEDYKDYKENPYRGIDVVGEIDSKVALMGQAGTEIESYTTAVKEESASSGSSLNPPSNSSSARLILDGSDTKEVVHQGDLTITGKDLVLKEGATLYVEGELKVAGSVTGKGSIYASNGITIEGSAELQGEGKKVALMSGKDITLKGHNLMDKFKENSPLKAYLRASDRYQKKTLERLTEFQNKLEANSTIGFNDFKTFSESAIGELPGFGKYSLPASSSPGETFAEMDLNVPANLSQFSSAVGGPNFPFFVNNLHTGHHNRVDRFLEQMVLGDEGIVPLMAKELERTDFVSRNLNSSLTSAEKTALITHVSKAYDSYTDIGSGPVRYVKKIGGLRQTGTVGSTSKVNLIKEKFSSIGLPEEDLDEIAAAYAGGDLKVFLEKVVRDEGRKVKLGEFISRADFRHYDLATVILALEYPEASVPYLLDSYWDCFHNIDGWMKPHMKALYEIYGREGFMRLNKAMIAQIQDIDFRYPGRTSFQGLVYAKGKIISDNPFFLDGVVVAEGQDGGNSAFGDGTVFSFSPETELETEEEELTQIVVSLHLEGEL